MNSLRPTTAYERATHKRYASLLKPIRSSNNSPIPTDSTMRSPLSTTRDIMKFSLPNPNNCTLTDDYSGSKGTLLTVLRLFLRF